MIRTPRSGLLRVVSIVFAALPVAFALIRAVRTGYDLRYLWVALAALLGAAVVMTVGRGRSSMALSAAAALSAVALVAAMLLATLAALFLGTTLGPGILVVTFSFAVCCAASGFVYMLATDHDAQ